MMDSDLLNQLKSIANSTISDSLSLSNCLSANIPLLPIFYTFSQKIENKEALKLITNLLLSSPTAQTLLEAFVYSINNGFEQFALLAITSLEYNIPSILLKAILKSQSQLIIVKIIEGEVVLDVELKMSLSDSTPNYDLFHSKIALSHMLAFILNEDLHTEDILLSNNAKYIDVNTIATLIKYKRQTLAIKLAQKYKIIANESLLFDAIEYDCNDYIRHYGQNIEDIHKFITNTSSKLLPVSYTHLTLPTKRIV